MPSSVLLLLVMIVIESGGKYLKLDIPIYFEGINWDPNPSGVV